MQRRIPVFGIGIGVPFRKLIQHQYLNLYDHIFIREKTDLRKMQQYMGTEYAHYMPDLGFALELPFLDKKEIIEKRQHKKVGVFLASSLLKYPHVYRCVEELLKYILSKKQSKIIFYLMNTMPNSEENDFHVSNKMLPKSEERRGREKKNVLVDEARYSSLEIIKIMREDLDFAICMRFHSHIFCTLAKLPFISLVTSRKSELFVVEEKLLSWSYIFNKDSNGNPVSGKPEDLIHVYERAISESDNISESLRYMHRNLNSQIKQIGEQISNLIFPQLPIKFFKKRPQVFNLAQRKLDTKSLAENIWKTLSQNVKIDLVQFADDIIFTLTQSVSSKYTYGFTEKLRSLVEKEKTDKDAISFLHENLKWVKKDFNKQYRQSLPKFNINYINPYVYGNIHRSGWEFVVDHLQALSASNGVILDLYLDRTFLWGRETLKNNAVIPYTSPWVGFMHHCFNVEFSGNNAELLLESKEFQASLHTCQGIYCLSDVFK